MNTISEMLMISAILILTVVLIKEVMECYRQRTSPHNHPLVTDVNPLHPSLSNGYQHAALARLGNSEVIDDTRASLDLRKQVVIDIQQIQTAAQRNLSESEENPNKIDDSSTIKMKSI